MFRAVRVAPCVCRVSMATYSVTYLESAFILAFDLLKKESLVSSFLAHSN